MKLPWGARAASLILLWSGLAAAAPPLDPRVIAFRFTPTARTQIVLWIERPDGTFLRTVRLTQGVAYRGIGNRPGAAQMNSGFRWPYGRREGVLPIWAHRRAAAPGASSFKRVIFQNRVAEGQASIDLIRREEVSDSTSDPYFCLSFIHANNALDAVTCASVFMSDKGRFLAPGDTAGGYAEPAIIGGQDVMRPLTADSLYPPRRDVSRCDPTKPFCYDHPDLAAFGEHARSVMPEIDAVTMATPVRDDPQVVLFTVPNDLEEWPSGDYVAWAEVNVEGDYNPTFNAETYPTPTGPGAAWDSWAISYGYPFRGQPSVVFAVPFKLGDAGKFFAAKPIGYGPVDGTEPDAGSMRAIDASISDDPVLAPGSGADRFRLVGDRRLEIEVLPPTACVTMSAPDVPQMLAVAPVDDEKNSHQWGKLHFVVPQSPRPLDHIEVRFSKAPILAGDLSSFMRGAPAVAASIDAPQLKVPLPAPGSAVDVQFGGMEPLTRYWVAVRAVDHCNNAGPFAVAELTTTRITFTQLAGCFVATAAFGSAFEADVTPLRNVRDLARRKSGVAAATIDMYYRTGPAAADVLRESDVARAVIRSVLGPFAALARAVR